MSNNRPKLKLIKGENNPPKIKFSLGFLLALSIVSFYLLLFGVMTYVY